MSFQPFLFFKGNLNNRLRTDSGKKCPHTTFKTFRTRQALKGPDEKA
jgi:hypothetical protein